MELLQNLKKLYFNIPSSLRKIKIQAAPRTFLFQCTNKLIKSKKQLIFFSYKTQLLEKIESIVLKGVEDL